MLEPNKIGYIRRGKHAGFYIKVAYDPEDTGGYYVFFSRDFSEKTAEGYDNWYLDLEDVERLLGTLEIEWKD